jgi:uncharacterized membrane protein
MAHSHSHTAHAPLRGRTARVIAAVLVPAAIATLVALIWMWPRENPVKPIAGGAPVQVTGDVLSVAKAACPAQQDGAPGAGAGCGTVGVQLTSGKDEGRKITTNVPAGPGAPVVAPGDAVTLIYLPDSGTDIPYQIIDHQRGTPLWILALAFVLAVVAFGRWRGLSALAGLGLTFGVLLFFIVPAILAGEQPLLVAIAGSAAIMLSVLFLTHGINLPTAIAVIGTLSSLVLTGVLGAVFTALTHLTGVSSDDTTFVSAEFASVNMRGLLLAGIVIGSLGVLDDVAVTQSATVTELAEANPSYRFRQLYRAATRVGRAHIASVINTIILAYAGASLPLLILIAAGNQPLGQVVTNQQIAEELVRSGVGTLGLIAAVPITTALAAFAARRLPEAVPVDA